MTSPIEVKEGYCLRSQCSALTEAYQERKQLDWDGHGEAWAQFNSLMDVQSCLGKSSCYAATMLAEIAEAKEDA